MRPGWRVALGTGGVLVLGIGLTYSWWLAALGSVLVHDDGPRAADIAVVLAGDYSGSRVSKAAELVRQGFVPAVLVSGPNNFYGAHEDAMAIAYAVKQGYPAEWFVGFSNNALSTRQESTTIVPELQRRGVRRFLLVTSNYHTARARRLFAAAQRKCGAHMEMHVIGSQDYHFAPASWWRDREGCKTFFFEWSKTVATALGM